MICGKSKAVLCFVFCLNAVSQACPSVCTCKWKNGKQTVECNNRELLAIPKGIDSGTQVLEFSHNNLMMLTKEKFLRMDLINLQRIYVSNCRIATIDDHTFKGLTNLVELDLGNNLLTAIPSHTFVDCPSLMKLTLSWNPIKVVRKNSFNHLAYLNTLEMSNCDIALIEEGAFRGLHSLEWLYVGGNKLTTLLGSRALPQSLRGAEFRGNPWECDCHLVDFHAWLLDFNLPNSGQPLCNGPSRLFSHEIRSIPVDELACLPNVSPTTFYLEVGEGRNVSLLCHAYAVPEAQVAWWFQGRVLQNDTFIAPGARLVYYIEEGSDDKKSELFIYNTHREDNGTFTCSAENGAGMVMSNFTIRIIIKEEATEMVSTFTMEYVLMLLSTAAALAVILVCIVLLYALKCSRANARKRRSNGKISTLPNSTKDSLLHDEYCETTKSESTASSVGVEQQQQEMALYTRASLNEEHRFGFTSPAMSPNQLSTRPYQLEQNPDLINDTESVGRGRDEVNRDSYGKAMENAITDFELPSNSHPHAEASSEFRSSSRETYNLSADVHLNPIGLLSADDCRTHFSGNFYRTLPHKRRGHAVMTTYSHEAEFFPVSAQPAQFCENVRYTADGYPVRSLPCEALPHIVVQWPHCLPGNIQCASQQSVAKRCVAAQTENEDLVTAGVKCTKPHNKKVLNVKVHEVLTESPDEGYEGETGDVNNGPT